ncbi:MAG: acetolactate synthase small subunit [Candidatus Omnitrophica bacterium]|nr:acetolactate synthase small subunit [Candidatus Omnitrophota bacterium]
MKHTISVLVENRPGVLARISGLFSARAFNIDSLAVGETHDPSISRMTIIVDAKDERVLEQIKKQLNKLIDTISVTDLTNREFIERELILIKIVFAQKNKKQLESLSEKFRAHILFIKGPMAIIEISDEKERIDQFLKELERFEIKELVRTGRIAIDKHI